MSSISLEEKLFVEDIWNYTYTWNKETNAERKDHVEVMPGKYWKTPKTRGYVDINEITIWYE